jgi:hypothetical protein
MWIKFIGNNVVVSKVDSNRGEEGLDSDKVLDFKIQQGYFSFVMGVLARLITREKYPC